MTKDGLNRFKTKKSCEGYISCDPELRYLTIIKVLTQKHW